MRAIVSVLVLMMLSACLTHPTMFAHSFEGQPTSSLLSCLGAPHSAVQSNGLDVWTYSAEDTNVFAAQGAAFTTNNYCRLSFTVRNAQVATSNATFDNPGACMRFTSACKAP